MHQFRQEIFDGFKQVYAVIPEVLALTTKLVSILTGYALREDAFRQDRL